MILSIFHIEKFCLFFKLYLRSRPPLSFRAKNGYPSGWRKRKTKEDKLKKAELAASKSHKMTDFFTQQRDDRNTSSSIGQNAKELQITKSCWKRRRQRRKLSRKMQVPLSSTRMTLVHVAKSYERGWPWVLDIFKTLRIFSDKNEIRFNGPPTGPPKTRAPLKFCYRSRTSLIRPCRY